MTYLEPEELTAPKHRDREAEEDALEENKGAVITGVDPECQAGQVKIIISKTL